VAQNLFRTLTPGPLRGFSLSRVSADGSWRYTNRQKNGESRSLPQANSGSAGKIVEGLRPNRFGAYWLPSRLEKVPVKPNVSVTRANIVGTRNKTRIKRPAPPKDVDLVVLATGYRIDITKYQIIDGPLQATDPENCRRLSSARRRPSNLRQWPLHGGRDRRANVGAEPYDSCTGTSNAGPRLAASIISRRKSTDTASKRNGSHV